MRSQFMVWTALVVACSLILILIYHFAVFAPEIARIDRNIERLGRAVNGQSLMDNELRNYIFSDRVARDYH
jgi:hypothetical protein